MTRTLGPRWLQGAALCVTLASGCGSGNAPRVAPLDRVEGEREFLRVRESYDVFFTFAGNGRAGGDTNDWDPSFEGAPAISVDLSTPHNALGDQAGNLFIADKDAHAIRKVDPNGRLTTVAGLNEPGDDGDQPALGASSHLFQPNGLWVTLDGTVYILDLGNQKVRKLDTQGELSTLFAVPGLSLGRGLWVSNDETLAYVSSGTRVLRWTPEDGVETYADGFQQLGNLFVDPGGAVFLTDREAGRVFRLTEGGAPVPFAGSGRAGPVIDGAVGLEAALQGVRGIWQHPEEGGFFLATHEGSQVLYLNSQGYLHILVAGARRAHAGDGEPLSVPGPKVSEVRNVTLSPAGDLIVIENDLGFIRVARRKR